MLSVFHSTKLEQLADKLMNQLNDHKRDHILQPEIFVVQNHGIGQWLSLYMAKKQGIAANMEFEFPSERIWKLIRMMDDDIPQRLPSDRQPLSWQIFSLLQDEKICSQFPNLQHYVRHEETEQRLMRSWKLASQIADVFDQYLIYRPQMLRNWQKGNHSYGSDESEAWQMRLWNALIAEYEGEWTDRAQLQSELLKHLQNGNFEDQQLPERIIVFGVSSMSPVFVDVLAQLSDHTAVHFYQFNIQSQGTADNDFSHPIIKSMGKRGRETMSLINSKGSKLISVTDNPSQPQNLLQQLQRDLKSDFSDDISPRLPLNDSSLQMHSCYSTVREVEVLYDQLLQLLDENPDMMPDDMLIMLPNIDTYAPIIESVFGNPDEGQPDIPFHISDSGAGGGQPIPQTFLAVLNCANSRFNVTDIIDLLDLGPIQQAFDFKDDDLEEIERWINDNHIRWGISGEFKKNKGLPSGNSFTWKSGLQRMFLGYMVNADSDRLYQNISPYQEIASAGDAQILGHFSHLMQELFDLNDELNTKKTPAQWIQYLLDKLPVFLSDSDDYIRAVSGIRKTLKQLDKAADLGNFMGKVPFNIIQTRLKEELEDQSSGGGKLGQGVTFSSMTTMRSIPFKMIGLVGMNDDAFPRSSIATAFNLIKKHPQPGDPNKARDDRYHFLETICSARSHLYISYLGKSERSDTEYPPSVVVSELLDFLENKYGLTAYDLVTQHPLQPFSPDYFNNELLGSYSMTNERIARELVTDQRQSYNFLDNPLPQPNEKKKSISVNGLVSFFQHPAKYLFRDRLGISLRDEEALTEDREPFEVDGLGNYQIGQKLMDRYLKQEPIEQYEQQLRAQNMLPEGKTGSDAFRKKLSETEKFGSYIDEKLHSTELRDIEVDTMVKDIRIIGKLAGIVGEQRISYRFGRARAKDLTELWIKHLLFNELPSEDVSGISQFFSWHKDTLSIYKLDPVADSDLLLEDFIEIYKLGVRQDCGLYCDCSYRFAKYFYNKEKSEEEALEKAVSKWEPGYSWEGEGKDDYNQLLAGDSNPLEDPQFTERSKQFWEPFFEILSTEEI